MRPQRGRNTLTLDNSMSPDGLDGREPAGGSVKRKEWIPFVSLGVFLASLNLAIAGLGFDRIARLEVRIDRIEERLNDLDRRVSRIEGILMIRVDRAELSRPAEPNADDPPPP